MAYITRGELIESFGQHEIERLENNIARNHDPALTENQKALITENAIEQASNEADSYIATRYILPLPSVPDQLKRNIGDIARYILYKDQPTDEVLRRYEMAISWLNKLSTGKAILVFPIEPKGDDGQPIAGTGIFVV
ncbi:gp436 family protein [Acinetobacter indicus]|uniref:gp436 family protein n=1 Tax=Acinetobacter indicus TaxID=756892 RepID=UPI000CEBE6CC|nr:DUF1320 domain-containing protein [Acinetobacter indicus]